MRTRFALMLGTLTVLASVAPALAGPTQTDWSDGPGAPDPLPAWTATFDAATGVSWRAVPGQLSLSSVGMSVGTAHNVASFIQGAFGVEVVDIDHDGDQDIIGVSERARKVTIWYNDGASPPTFTAEDIATSYVAVAAVVAEDMNGDGLLDLVTSAGTITGKVTCYLNQGGSPAVWTTSLVDPQWGEAWEIATADVDGDGHRDVVGTSLSQGSVVWWENDGQDPPGWTRHAVDPVFEAAHSARAADLDGDGHVDVVGCGTVSQEVAWWKNSGTSPPTWTKSVIDAAFAGGRSVRIADIDGDGDRDFAAVGFNGEARWWRNDGGEPLVWTAQSVDDGMAQLHQLQIADMDGDGRLDLIAADYQGNSLAWWRNGGGSAPTWTRFKPVYNINRPLAVDVGDVDGDGALELVGSSNGLGQFVWYDATTFAAQGTLTSAVVDRGAGGALSIDWTADLPTGTGLVFRVRDGDDPGNLGDWSPDVAAPGLLGPDLGRYVQYEVELTTGEAAVSPILHEVRFVEPVADVPGRSSGLGLRAYPNPANPRVTLAYEIPRAGPVRLEIYDARGRRLTTLLDGSAVAGPGSTAWDGTDAAGRAVATGVYHVVLRSGDDARRSRVTLVR